MLKRQRQVYAFEWLPVVRESERAAYEAEARGAGLTDYRFWEIADGKPREAGRRVSYVPIHYMEPPSALALGFDLAADPIRWSTAENARDSGRIAASQPFGLIEDAGKPDALPVVGIYSPVYREGDPASLAARRKALTGFTMAIVRVAPVVDLRRHGRRHFRPGSRSARPRGAEGTSARTATEGRQRAAAAKPLSSRVPGPVRGPPLDALGLRASRRLHSPEARADRDRLGRRSRRAARPRVGDLAPDDLAAAPPGGEGRAVPPRRADSATARWASSGRRATRSCGGRPPSSCSRRAPRASARSRGSSGRSS